MENGLVVPQKVKSRISLWHSDSTPRSTPERTGNRCSKNSFMASVHSSNTIRNSRKVEMAQVSMTRGIKKLWSMPTLEYYSGLRIMYWHLLRCWVNPESMRLPQTSQTPKTTCMFPFIGNVQNRHILGQSVDEWLPGGWEGGTGSDNLVGRGYSSEPMKTFWNEREVEFVQPAEWAAELFALRWSNACHVNFINSFCN